MLFELSLSIVSLFSGVVASLSGFGIGSLITPLLGLKTGISVAVGAVSIIHFFGTLLRFIIWRKYINKKVLFTFGLTSAFGGLLGALLHNILFSSVLTIIFGCLLLFTGVMGFTGLADKFRLKGAIAWIAGGVSGLFGGLVGNQGGVRSAALFGFELNQKEFVATATGIALMVDIARMPVYIATQSSELLSIWPLILLGTIFAMIGTFIGSWLLNKIPEKLFKKIVCVIIFFIGIFVLI
jgi:uncharacterized protein